MVKIFIIAINCNGNSYIKKAAKSIADYHYKDGIAKVIEEIL